MLVLQRKISHTDNSALISFVISNLSSESTLCIYEKIRHLEQGTSHMFLLNKASNRIGSSVKATICVSQPNSLFYRPVSNYSEDGFLDFKTDGQNKKFSCETRELSFDGFRNVHFTLAFAFAIDRASSIIRPSKYPLGLKKPQKYLLTIVKKLTNLFLNIAVYSGQSYAQWCVG